MDEISFAEVILRKGAELLQDAAGEPRAPVDTIARLLAGLALTDGPLVVQSDGGGQPELFDEATRLSAAAGGERMEALACARQAERAVLFEFAGSGPLAGSRVIAAVLRPEAREDLLDACVAVGRLRNGTAEVTAVPATVRFDAAALAQTLALIGPADRLSANASQAALAHAARLQPMPGQEAEGVPAPLLELFWHAFRLASVRARGAAPTH